MASVQFDGTSSFKIIKYKRKRDVEEKKTCLISD